MCAISRQFNVLPKLLMYIKRKIVVQQQTPLIYIYTVEMLNNALITQSYTYTNENHESKNVPPHITFTTSLAELIDQIKIIIKIGKKYMYVPTYMCII